MKTGGGLSPNDEPQSYQGKGVLQHILEIHLQLLFPVWLKELFIIHPQLFPCRPWWLRSIPGTCSNSLDASQEGFTGPGGGLCSRNSSSRKFQDLNQSQFPHLALHPHCGSPLQANTTRMQSQRNKPQNSGGHALNAGPCCLWGQEVKTMSPGREK